MVGERVYLDYAASTPVDEGVLEAMKPYFSQLFGNPSSIHSWGQQAEAAVENARAKVAQVLRCDPEEVVFTGCGSESDNLAIRGVAFAERQRRDANHILTTPVEHPAVLQTVRQLAQVHGFEVEWIPVNRYGRVDPEDLKRKLRPDTAVVSVIFANNEIGTVNPIHEIGQICRAAEVPLHTDAVQASSQLPIAVDDLEVDLLSIGAHKFYGPKGVGALFVRRGTVISPAQTGGSQEFGLRAGTHNVPLIVGLAEALRLTVSTRQTHNRHFERLRDHLIEEVLARIPEVQLTGHPESRLPNHASFVFRDLDGNQLLAALDLAGYGCSSGSACKTGKAGPSEVLTAIGYGPDWALGSLRVTVGRATTDEQVEGFISALAEIVHRTRQIKANPL